MGEIEQHLHAHFAAQKDEPEDGGTSINEANTTTSGAGHFLVQPLEEPFARVNSVAAGSPADRAGLKVNDLVKVFGHVNEMNHDNLKKVAECVMGSEDVRTVTQEHMSASHDILAFTNHLQRPLVLKISRPTQLGPSQELQLTLVPSRNWGGRGLLGCHILPYEATNTMQNLLD
jgi:26S proteasome regulatory subunit N4